MAVNGTCDHFVNSVCTQSPNVPWYYSYNPSLISGLSDYSLAIATPIVAYWSLSLAFHYLDTRDWKSLEQYRIHPSTEVASRPRVTPRAVVLAVLFQQLLQTAAGVIWMANDHTLIPDHSEKVANIARRLALVLGSGEQLQPLLSGLAYTVYWWAIPLFQLFLGMAVMDTWQYFLHRGMHMNKFMYRHFHSWHHRVDAPYAFAAQYNHPVEAFLLDALGALISESVSGMGPRQVALLFAIATFKTVDDHCGYRLPFDPLQIMSKNNADYHDIHHQKIGIKSNFSQPFFVHWDTLLGTAMTREEMEARQQKIRAKME